LLHYWRDLEITAAIAWGYFVEGAMRMTYDDGTEELLQAGDVFYMPSGHVGVVEKDLKIIDFSPQKEFSEVLAHVEKKMAEMGG
jgi:quercetin dioxygenase-like cupin family protein